MAESPRPPDAGSGGTSEPAGSTPGMSPPAPSAAPRPSPSQMAAAESVAPAPGAPPATARTAPAVVAGTVASAPMAAGVGTAAAAAATAPAASLPPAVAAAEAAARHAAAQMTVRGRAWWGQLDPTNKRPTLIVAAALIALVIGSQFLNALVPVPRGGGGGGGGGGAQQGVGAPVDIGSGIRVTPPAGWVAIGTPTDLPGVKFQRGAVVVEVGIASFSAAPRDLLIAYVNQILAPSAQDANVSDTSNVTAGNGRPTARATYNGTFKDVGTAIEGELSAQVLPGSIGIVVNAHAPQGQLRGLLADVHAFVDTIEVRS